MSGTSIPAWARPGVKCVCVDARAADFNKKDCFVRGEVYVLGEVWMNYGVPACSLTKWPTCAVRLSRFRPLVSDSDELGIETIIYRQKRLKSKTSVRSVERA